MRHWELDWTLKFNESIVLVKPDRFLRVFSIKWLAVMNSSYLYCVLQLIGSIEGPAASHRHSRQQNRSAFIWCVLQQYGPLGRFCSSCQNKLAKSRSVNIIEKHSSKSLSLICDQIQRLPPDWDRGNWMPGKFNAKSRWQVLKTTSRYNRRATPRN